MRVALAVPVAHDGATFEVVMPDALMARLFPTCIGVLSGLPDEVAEALSGGGVDTTDMDMMSQIGSLLLDEKLLAVVGEAFDAGVVEWRGVEADDGSPLACSPKNKAYIPLVDKLAVVFGFLGQQRVLAAKKEPAM